MQRGFSTVEILIALAIMTITLSAVVITSFGAGSLVLGGNMNAEAMSEAQGLLEQQQALARKDFNLVVATSSTKGVYARDVAVEQQSDLLTKKVSVRVAWQGEYGNRRDLTLTTLVTNFNHAIGGNTCSSVATGDWRHPRIVSVALDALISTSSSDHYALSDIDAYKGRLYITAAKTTYSTDPTLFVFDITNSINPKLLGYVDDSKNNSAGLNAVRVGEDLANNKIYAYAASARSISGAANFGQLQIVDVSNVSLRAWAPTITAYKIAGLSSVGTGGDGRALFYDNGYVYLGLTTGAGAEFHILDVQSPTAPYEIGKWPSSGSMGNSVNAISEKDGFAYVAHPAGIYHEQVTVLDVSNPTLPQRVGSFFDPGGIGGNGKSVYVEGDSLYLGRTATNISGAADTKPEWYALDVNDPSSIGVPPIAQFAMPTSGDSVNGVLVRGDLAFIISNASATIISAKSASIVASLKLPSSGSSFEPSFDCENNVIYLVSNDAQDNGTLSIITAL